MPRIKNKPALAQEFETLLPERDDESLLAAQKHVLESIVRGLPLTEVLTALCEIVEAQAQRGVRAAILLVDPSGATLRTGAAPSLPDAYNRAVDGIGIAPNFGTCCAAAATQKVVITPDIATDPGWTQLRHLPLALGLKAAWSMPIISSSGAVLGTFGTYFAEAREPTFAETQLVDVLATTAALAIERQQADEALRQDAVRHDFLARLAAATQPLIDANAVMATTARMLAEHLDADRCAYAEVEDERVFVITGDYARGVPSIVGNWDVAAFGAGCVRDMLADRAFVVNDTDTHHDITADDLPAYRATNIRAVVCVPLHKNGKFTAAMAVHQTTPRQWSSREIELVVFVVARCWEALERSRVTRTLRESEARYRAMVEASPESVKLLASDGTILQINETGQQLLEIAEHDAIGLSFYDFVAPEFRVAYQRFNENICNGERGICEFELIGSQGTRRWLESKAVPLPAAQGGFVQLGVTRDMSARVTTERALMQSRARLDYVVQLSGIGFWYCDLPFDELTWDETVRQHFFVKPDAKVSINTFYDHIHPDDREFTRQAIAISITERKPYDVIYRTINPGTGEVKFIRAVGGTAYADDGTPMRFDGVTVDLTAQKLDQEQLAQLLEREQVQARLLRQVADAALTIHQSDSVEAVLKAVTQEARTIIGAHQAMTSLTLQNDGARTFNFYSASKEYHAERDNVWQGGVGAGSRPPAAIDSGLADEPGTVTAGNGSTPAAALSGGLAMPFIAKNGTSLGLVQLRDKYEGEFSEIDEAILIQLCQTGTVALENASLYDQLREQDRRKDEFLATLAHELRNPLAPVRTGLQVLQLSPDEDQQYQARQMMERQLVHLVRMVDDLLDVSRVTLGKLTLKKEHVDFRTILHSAFETTRPLIESRGHELAVRLPKDPLPLDADVTRLGQVVSNLLNNAAKYTPPGGRIQISAETVGQQLVVRVQDTGVGIQHDMLPRIFEMFVQVGRSVEHAQGGLGIGLTLVRRLVEMHGGTIQADSAGPGKGSTFILRLPLAPLPAVEVDAAAAQHGESHQTKLRLLVVDDNVDAAESLAMLLRLGGHKTAVAHEGYEALQMAREIKPDAILLDIGLPGLSGYEVAQQLRQDTAYRPLLIALTGWGSEDDRRQALEAGFDLHMVKPVAIGALNEALAGARPQMDTHF